jgi:uncharacterized membrane protein YgcG
MSTPPGQPPEFSEEELRALEAEMERITVDDVLLQTIVSLINLGARKAGLGGPEGPPADLEQTRQAIEGARALMPLVEARHGDQLGQVRQALSQLQMAYVQQSGRGPEGEGGEGPEGGEPGGGGSPGGGGPQGGQPPREGGAGPAQRSGRLWVPGQ